MANHTYVWVDFYGEDASKPSPVPAGLGRIVFSMGASKDETSIYDPDSPASIDPERLVQIDKLVKTFSPVLEAGHQPAHGTAVDTANKDVVAAPIRGTVGSVKIFWR